MDPRPWKKEIDAATLALSGLIYTYGVKLSAPLKSSPATSPDRSKDGRPNKLPSFYSAQILIALW